MGQPDLRHNSHLRVRTRSPLHCLSILLSPPVHILSLTSVSAASLFSSQLSTPVHACKILQYPSNSHQMRGLFYSIFVFDFAVLQLGSVV